MANDHRDYSGTPLWKKLGIREGSRVRVVNAPDGFDAALEAIAPLPPDVHVLARTTAGIDVALVFVTRLRDLDRRFDPLAEAIRVDGRLWVAWPKKASGLPTDLTFEAVQERGLAAGLVDNKTASITDDFQGCQFVYRVADRPRIQAERADR